MDPARARRPWRPRGRSRDRSTPRPATDYLVCSDGLSSYVDEQDDRARTCRRRSADRRDRLVDLALRAGGAGQHHLHRRRHRRRRRWHRAEPILDGAVAEPRRASDLARRGRASVDPAPATGQSRRATAAQHRSPARRRRVPRRHPHRCRRSSSSPSTSTTSGTSQPTRARSRSSKGVQGNAAGVEAVAPPRADRHPGHRAAAGRPRARRQRDPGLRWSGRRGRPCVVEPATATALRARRHRPRRRPQPVEASTVTARRPTPSAPPVTASRSHAAPAPPPCPLDLVRGRASERRACRAHRREAPRHRAHPRGVRGRADSRLPSPRSARRTATSCRAGCSRTVSGFAALAIGAHLAVRWLAPYADPVLLPAAIALNGIGLVLIHRLDLRRRETRPRHRSLGRPRECAAAAGLDVASASRRSSSCCWSSATIARSSR